MFKLFMFIFATMNIILYFTDEANRVEHLVAAAFCLNTLDVEQIKEKLDKFLEKK